MGSSDTQTTRTVAEACEEADVALAYDLYANGVLPEADADDEEICMEADGCWIPLQDGGNVEVKAMVAYAGKAGPGRVERVRPVRFGCVSGPRVFWAQGMAATATRFDMSKVRVCHAGFDDEAWCKQAADYLPAAASVDGNLDPFHVNRAIGSCFAEPGADAGRQVMQCIWFGRAGDVADLLEALADDGLARPKNAAQVVRSSSAELRLAMTTATSSCLIVCRQSRRRCARRARKPDCIA